MAKRRRAKRKRQRFPKSAGSKAKPKKKIETLFVGKGVDVWNVQKALRKDGYFARAVDRDRIATNAPMAKPL